MKYREHSRTHIANSVRETIDHEATLLDKRLAHVQDDLKLLDITFEYHERNETYTAKLVLHVLGETMVATAIAVRQSTAVRKAFDDLNDQLDAFLAKLKHLPEIRDEQRKPAWQPEPSLPID
jgi:ribosome-associated translation inhibitor RaiA